MDLIEKIKNGSSSLEFLSSLERYHKIDLLSSKDNSDIYLIRDNNSQRREVLKIFSGDVEDKYSVDEFIHEPQILSTLAHPNIIPIHNINASDDGIPFYTMKFIEGNTIAKIVRSLKHKDKIFLEDFNTEGLLRSFIQICDAMIFTHSKNIVNLNLNPYNIKIGSYGQTYITDWSNIKYLGKMEEVGTRTLHKLMFKDIKKSTHELEHPHYAPFEQLTTQDDANEQYDIYSLGAILYYILTYQHPFKGKDKDETSENITHHNITFPLKNRFSNKKIDKEVMAIAKKAMETNRDKKYSTCCEMRNDILKYLEGEETKAYPDDIFRKINRFSNKHKHTRNILAIVLSCILFVAFYIFNQHQKTLETWNPEFNIDMRITQAIKKEFILTERIGDKKNLIESKDFVKDGMLLSKGKWLWLDKRHFAKSLRIEVEFSWLEEDEIDGFEICFNSRRKRNLMPAHLPQGYSIQIGGWQGKINLLSINDGSKLPNLTNVADCSIYDTKRHKIIIERKNEYIDIFLDGDKILSDVDPIPYSGGELGGIGFRTWSDSLVLQDIKIYSRVLPLYSSPLEVGDAFVDEGFNNRALKEYLNLYYSHYDLSIIEMALRKSIIISNKIGKHKLAKQLISDLKREFPNSPFNEKLLEIEIISAWKSKNYSLAFSLLNKVKTDLKKVLVLKKILRLKHYPLPYEVSNKLLKTLALKDVFIDLDISNYGIKDIWSLKKMNLQKINCRNNQIEDISILSNMPLKVIDISNNPISEIPNFTKQSIVSFKADNTKLNNIEFLKNQFLLESLNISKTDIVDFTPLKNLKIKSLSINNNNCKQFDLLDLNLTYLENINANNAKLANLDLSKLKNIKTISIENNNFKNLDFLMNKEFLQFPNFFSENLNKENLIELKNSWKKKNINQKHLRNIDILITTFIEKNYSDLENFAIAIKNKKYLLIPYNNSFTKALEIAELANGSLIAFETKEEYQNFFDVFKEFMPDFWIDKGQKSEDFILSQSNYNLNNQDEIYWTLSPSAGNIINKVTSNNYRNFIIEWEK